MAKDLKAKESKKTGRRLKKTVRKTLGTVCLISAILIASIPTEGLKQVSADTVTENKKLDETAMEKYYNIPDLSGYNGEIYTTGNGQFQFAYVTPDGKEVGPTKIAVILGYSNVGTLEGGTLRIPDSVDAYLNYRANDGTGQGYAAVGKSGNYLFYRTEEIIPPELDVSGNEITPEEIIYSYHVCLYSDRQSWEEIDSDDLYYYPTDDFRPAEGVEPKRVGDGTTDDYTRIKEAVVAYIGNQYVESDGAGGWKIGQDTDAEHGMFAGKGSIENLIVGENLSGIGNYAFYNCTSLNSITLSNALNTIGNYAFAGCLNMHTVSLNSASDITAIGTHAFEDCQALTSFTVPVNVTAIGDAAFKGCWSMRTIDLCGGDKNVALSTLGYDLFVDCQQLQSITFPKGFREDVDISNFKGCLSLGSITVSNTSMNITENFGKSSGTPVFGYDDFKQQYNDSTVVHGTFYFEGPTNATNPSTLHRTAMDNYFAFSYLNEADLTLQDIYELTVKSGNKKATYRVNSADTLISSVLDDGIEDIELPEYIGPNYIKTIGSTAFRNYCFVKMLTIPSTVENIEENAFSGCHKLEYVTFENPANLSIADGAFRTQEVTHRSTCPDRTLSTEPKLTFIGPISTDSAPFLYAMNKSNKINVGNQLDSYIRYFSGWPTSLVVQYNPDTDKNELQDYPTLNDLASPSSTVIHEIYSVTAPDLATEYDKAMLGAHQKMARNSSSEAVTNYETQIWDAVMNIVLPAGIEGVQAGLFKEKEVDSGEAADQYFKSEGASYKTLTAYGLKDVAGDDNPDDDEDTGCFANCENFKRIALYGETESIGDYAFKGCTNLTSVTIPDTVTEMGKIPFTGCSKLSTVDFQSSKNFSCDNSIIYQLDSAGNKYKLVEFLEGRPSGSVSAAETAGIKEVAAEAFSGTKASFVDLSESSVERILEGTFENCNKLISVVLPDSLRSVANHAFKNCPNLQRMEVPNLYTVFYDEAVDTVDNRPDDLVFVCNEDSLAAEYARKYGFEIDPNGMEQKYKVTWEDWDGTELKVEYVVQGKDATPPKGPDYTDPSVPGHRPGYDFVGWNKEYTGISESLTITAMYEMSDPNANKVKVTFYDDDQVTVLYTVDVTIGQKVQRPKPDPVKTGYVFIGWLGDFDAPIVAPTSFYAQWEALDGRLVVRFINDDGTVLNQQMVNPGEDAYEPKTPEPALEEHKDWRFAGWVPSDFTNITKDTDFYATYTNGNSTSDGNGGNGNGSGGNGSGGSGSGGNGSGGSGADDTEAVLYTLTVQNGSGSGSYVAGSQPVIVANDPPSGQEFSHWTIEPSDTKIASTTLSATVVTMPEKNVIVTAHYKTKTGSSSGSSTVSGNNSNRPGSNSGTVSSGTTVVIDKNGLSNTGVVSATVRGSSDNFTIKITESTAASEAVLKALQAEYGDISKIKYFPMDISLYDSTGTKKITDTTGLSVTITLPIPDSLITYAGNNKVAAVNSSNRLDKLSPKFTTIDRVACVTFTAEHFSPYVIYVETDNLLESTVVDYTPKTGDGIHPKWFLSIGLACVAVVLFMKRDKRSLRAAKAV